MNMLYSNGYIVTYRKTRSLLQSVTGANTRQLTTVRVVSNGFQLLIWVKKYISINTCTTKTIDTEFPKYI